MPTFSFCYFGPIKHNVILSALCGNIIFNVSSTTHPFTLPQKWENSSEFVVTWPLQKWPVRGWSGCHFGALSLKRSKTMSFKKFWISARWPTSNDGVQVCYIRWEWLLNLANLMQSFNNKRSLADKSYKRKKCTNEQKNVWFEHVLRLTVCNKWLRKILNCNSYTSVGKTCRVDGELHTSYTCAMRMM